MKSLNWDPFNDGRLRSWRDVKEEVERKLIHGYVDVCLTLAEGNISEAARRAGMDRSNFKRLLVRKTKQS